MMLVNYLKFYCDQILWKFYLNVDQAFEQARGQIDRHYQTFIMSAFVLALELKDYLVHDKFF